jgi:predicted nucleotidyltransferase
MDMDILTARKSLTKSMSLEEVRERLTRNPSVLGIMLMGSARQKKIKPWSDYDILVIVDKGPMPYRSLFTYIGGRMADVMLTGREMLDKLAAAADGPFVSGSVERVIELWIHGGHVLLDRTGLLAKIRERKGNRPACKPPPDLDTYRLWNMLNYSLRESERLAKAKDPIYQNALAMRLEFTIAPIIGGYLGFRGMEWRGEKEAFRYFKEKDPAFYRLLQRYFREGNVAKRLKLFRKMAEKVLEPVGGIWPDDVTAVTPVSEYDKATLQKAVADWESLFAPPSSPTS